MGENVSKSVSKSPSKKVEKKTQGAALPNISESIADELDRISPVAEMVSENGGSEPGGDDGSGQTQAQQSQAAKIMAEKREKLIASKPSKTKMVGDIRKSVKRKLAKLEKEEAHYKRIGVEAVHKYNDVVGRIRALRRVLSGLAHNSYEQLKAIWLRVVHNIV